MEERTLRVAYVVTDFPSVSETFVAGEIAGLLERGHQVDVYADRPGAAGPVHPIVERHGLVERTVYPAGAGERRTGAALVLRRLARLRPRVVAGWAAALRHGTKPAAAAVRYGAATGFRGASYDVIHAHFGQNGIKAAALRDAGVLAGPLAVTFHGRDMSAHVRKQGPRLYARLFETAELLLPVTDRWAARLVELGADPARIRVHRMGVDVAGFRFEPRRMHGGPLRIVTVARLVEKKGVEDVVRAVARAAQQVDCRCTIVGDGSRRARIEALIGELGVGERVTMAGWMDQAQVREAVAGSDVALLPSVTASNGDEEGLPVAIMEAMALGLPVVSTRHSGIPELVRDGVDGFLVGEREPDALAERLVRLARDPALRAGMGRSARGRVEALCDIAALNDRRVELYRSLVAGAFGRS